MCCTTSNLKQFLIIRFWLKSLLLNDHILCALLTTDGPCMCAVSSHPLITTSQLDVPIISYITYDRWSLYVCSIFTPFDNYITTGCANHILHYLPQMVPVCVHSIFTPFDNYITTGCANHILHYLPQMVPVCVQYLHTLAPHGRSNHVTAGEGRLPHSNRRSTHKHAELDNNNHTWRARSNQGMHT